MNTHADQYEFYWRGPFSQWHPSEFELDGVRFQTAEQAMMYLKAKLFDDLKIADAILVASTPDQQKALGRQVRGFDQKIWDENTVDIVRRVNRVKFGQNKGLRRKLFQTGDKALVEASPVDTIWGIGLSAQDAREIAPSFWPGQNLLGKILTELRAELSTEFPQEARASAP